MKADKLEATTDEHEIDEITDRFFDLFTNADDKVPNVRDLEKIFLTSGTIINNTEDEPVIYDLEGFINPREEILSNGTLVNFKEFETSQTTTIEGKIACRICQYKKSGEFNAEYFEGEGTKILQFIKTNKKWILSSVVWSDKK